MKFPAPQTPEEREAVAEALDAFREEWGFGAAFNMSRLLEKWKGCVESVEEGYPFSFYDYTHDLSLRDEIERLKNSVPARLRTEIQGFVEPLDQRLQFATEPARVPLGSAVYGPDRYWWLRVPKRRQGQLLEDLEREGIV